MSNLDNILKSRDISLSTKVCLVKAMVFPAFMYGCESWTIKTLRTEELMLKTLVLEKTFWESLRLQSEGLMLKLKLQNFGHLLRIANSLEKNTDTGKDWGQEEKGPTENEMVGWHYLTLWTWVWTNSRRWWRTGKPGVLQSMGLQSRTQLSNWTTTSLNAVALGFFKQKSSRKPSRKRIIQPVSTLCLSQNLLVC